MKVFLGGTCNESTWREELKPLLRIDYFDPVVEDWDEEAQRRELEERATCDLCLYVITPLMTGVYSIAEAVDDSNKRPEKTLFCYLLEDATEYLTVGQVRSLDAVGKLIQQNGGRYFWHLEDVAKHINAIAESLEGA